MLGLLKLAPQILGAVGGIVKAVTGDDPPAEAAVSPEAMAGHIESLPADQQAAIRLRIMDHIEAMEKETTARWQARMSTEAEASVEKIRATARPEIARQAMRLIYTPRLAVIWLAALLTVEYLVGLGFELWGCSTSGAAATVITVCKALPAGVSVTAMLAGLEPVIHMIWPIVIAAMTTSAAVVTAYMGARERDKARADEMEHGRPLTSAQATVAAAGGVFAQIVRAVRK